MREMFFYRHGILVLLLLPPCTHTHTHTHSHSHSHSYTYTHAHTKARTHTLTHSYARTRTRTHTLVHVSISIYTKTIPWRVLHVCQQQVKLRILMFRIGSKAKQYNTERRIQANNSILRRLRFLTVNTSTFAAKRSKNVLSKRSLSPLMRGTSKTCSST